MVKRWQWPINVVHRKSFLMPLTKVKLSSQTQNFLFSPFFSFWLFVPYLWLKNLRGNHNFHLHDAKYSEVKIKRGCLLHGQQMISIFRKCLKQQHETMIWKWETNSWGKNCRGRASIPTHNTTFILKKVMLVSKSTVDFRSCSRSRLLAGKLFCWQKRKILLESTVRSMQDFKHVLNKESVLETFPAWEAFTSQNNAQ